MSLKPWLRRKASLALVPSAFDYSIDLSIILCIDHDIALLSFKVETAVDPDAIHCPLPRNLLYIEAFIFPFLPTRRRGDPASMGQ